MAPGMLSASATMAARTTRVTLRIKTPLGWRAATTTGATLPRLNGKSNTPSQPPSAHRGSVNSTPKSRRSLRASRGWTPSYDAAMAGGTFDGMRIAEFAFPGPLRDGLVAAILRGDKTATAGLAAEYEEDGEPVPEPGELQVVVDSEGR